MFPDGKNSPDSYWNGSAGGGNSEGKGIPGDSPAGGGYSFTDTGIYV